jgi:hypothetical protein
LLCTRQLSFTDSSFSSSIIISFRFRGRWFDPLLSFVFIFRISFLTLQRHPLECRRLDLASGSRHQCGEGLVKFQQHHDLTRSRVRSVRLYGSRRIVQRADHDSFHHHIHISRLLRFTINGREKNLHLAQALTHHF